MSTLAKKPDWRSAAAVRAARRLTPEDKDFDMDDCADDDAELEVTPPDVVKALGFDPLDDQ